ncbi:type IV pilus assembly protein PilM [Pseudolysinimonas sp.]|uniref:type IV pilus assembly protein PilM n=1 Tax=Pseudolysinimonas sp. TaxID=2680009 RepID=UPI003F812863
MAKSVVGLDIGHGVLRAAEIVNQAHKPVLTRYFEMPVPIEAVNRGEVVDRDIVQRALRVMWSRARFKTKDVVLGMGNQRVLSRDYSVPEAPLARIREALPFQVQDLLPVPVADALLDFYPVSREQTEQGPMIHGLLIAAVKEAVLGNVETVESAGLRVAEVDLIPFALTRLLSSAEGVSALIDIGASTTNVVIAVAGVPRFVRVLPGGSRDVSDAIVARHGIAFEDAERIKRQVGVMATAVTPEQRPVIDTIHHATGELLGGVRNTIAYFASNHPELRVAELVLSGGGSDMPGIREAFSELTRLPIRDADPFQRVGTARSFAADGLRTARAHAPVAIGLALGSAA